MFQMFDDVQTLELSPNDNTSQKDSANSLNSSPEGATNTSTDSSQSFLQYKLPFDILVGLLMDELDDESDLSDSDYSLELENEKSGSNQEEEGEEQTSDGKESDSYTDITI